MNDTESDTNTPTLGTPSASTQEPTKPITIALPEDTLRKLRVIAIVKETSLGELIAEAASGVVKRDLRKALSKIQGE